MGVDDRVSVTATLQLLTSSHLPLSHPSSRSQYQSSFLTCFFSFSLSYPCTKNQVTTPHTHTISPTRPLPIKQNKSIYFLHPSKTDILHKSSRTPAEPFLSFLWIRDTGYGIWDMNTDMDAYQFDIFQVLRGGWSMKYMYVYVVGRWVGR